MSDRNDWYPKSIAWMGPQVMSRNGLELHAVVAQDQHGTFHAGTRYGPGGGAMPELGHEDFWCMQTFKEQGEAVKAAQADTARTLRECDQHARTKELLGWEKKPTQEPRKPAPSRGRGIDR